MEMHNVLAYERFCSDGAQMLVFQIEKLTELPKVYKYNILSQMLSELNRTLYNENGIKDFPQDIKRQHQSGRNRLVGFVRRFLLEGF